MMQNKERRKERKGREERKGRKGKRRKGNRKERKKEGKERNDGDLIINCRQTGWEYYPALESGIFDNIVKKIE